TRFRGCLNILHLGYNNYSAVKLKIYRCHNSCCASRHVPALSSSAAWEEVTFWGNFTIANP
ncbi:MAG: hypothetical protein ABSH48_24490, partial [Verrucomicrobiota bacterium]